MLKSLFKLHNIEYVYPILRGQFFTEKQYSIEDLSQFAYHCSKYIGDMNEISAENKQKFYSEICCSFLWCSPNFNKLSFQLRIGNIFDASWECYQCYKMTINRVSGKITVDFNVQITNLMGINLDLCPREVKI